MTLDEQFDRVREHLVPCVFVICIGIILINAILLALAYLQLLLSSHNQAFTTIATVAVYWGTSIGPLTSLLASVLIFVRIRRHPVFVLGSAAVGTMTVLGAAVLRFLMPFSMLGW